MARFSRWIFILISILTLAAAVYYNQATSESSGPPGPPGSAPKPAATTQAAEQKKPETMPPSANSSEAPKPNTTKPDRNNQRKAAAAPNVSVLEVNTNSYEAKVSAFGVAQPQHELQLKSQLEGHIVNLSAQFDNGLLVKKGDVLVTLDDSHYRANVAVAKADVADARLKLLEEKRAALQARKEWKMMALKGKPDSKLVLHGPQVSAAKANLNKANANLQSAQKDLQYAQITVPFNALVVERMVTPGSFVQSGAEVAKLYSSDRMEIAIALPINDWRNLPPADELIEKKWPVELHSVEGASRWLGYVSRVEQHLDETTRQRTLIIAVDNPLTQQQALYPGTFVEAIIMGKQVADLWKVPSSALSQRGEIWFVEKDKTISKIITETIFTDAGSLFIAAPKSLVNKPQQILANPLNSYLQGMAVTPVTSMQNEGTSHEE